MNLIKCLLILSASIFCNPLMAERDLSDTAVLSEMTEMAEHGYLEAQLMLGDWYFNGRQVGKSYQQAAKYFQLAAEQGNERAQCVLGGMYYLGKGVAKDAQKARYWLGLAADQGMQEAVALLRTVNSSKGSTRYAQSASTNKKPVVSSLNLMAR